MCFLWVSNGPYGYLFRNRSTRTPTRTQETSPRGGNISLFKTSLREEPWNTTHQQPRRVLQEALHVATSGKSWLGSREKIFYLEEPRKARAYCTAGIYRPYYYASAHRVVHPKTFHWILAGCVRKISRFENSLLFDESHAGRISTTMQFHCFPSRSFASE